MPDSKFAAESILIKQKRFILPFLFLIFLLSRIIFLDQKNVWADEAYSWLISSKTILDLIFNTATDFHPPNYYLILKYWMILFGDSILSTRMLSVIFGSLGILVFYYFAIRFLSSKETILALILYMVFPLNFYFSQETRMYTLNLILNLGSVYYFLKIIQFAESKDKNILWKDKLFYFLFTASAIYTHYFSFLILFSQLAFFMIIIRKMNRNIKRLIIIEFGFLLIIYIPWIPVLFFQAQTGQDWRNNPNAPTIIDNLTYFIKDFFIGYNYHLSDISVYAIPVILMLLIFLYLYSTNLKSIIKTRYFSSQKSGELLIYTLFLLPLMISLIISLNQRIILSRYLFIIAPYFVFSIILMLRKIKIRIIYLLCVCCIIIINIYGDYLYFKSNSKGTEYRELISALSTANINKGKIVVQPRFCGYVIDYYKDAYKLNIPNTGNYQVLPRMMISKTNNIIENISCFYSQIRNIRKNFHWDFKIEIDSVLYNKPRSFCLILDRSNDNNDYSFYLDSLNRYYEMKSYSEFNHIPYEQRVSFYEIRP